MKNNYVLIPIKQINQHEKLNYKNLKKVKLQLTKAKIYKNPIILDKKTLVVIDGHHRLNSCIQLGLTQIPSILVDYLNDDRIRVYSRRKNIFINKNVVIKKGLSSKLFPSKTTKHYIPYRIDNLKIPLNLL